MIFKRAIFLLAVFGPAASSSLEVFSDILLDHDAMYSTIQEPTVPYLSGKFAGQARLLPSFIRTLQEKIGIFTAVGNTQEPVTRLRLMTESSALHVDRYHSGRQGSPDCVGFVFLNTNPDAHFVHGESSVPVVEGRMVLFDGGIPHNTIVNSGSVKLLGPFDAKEFRGVGHGQCYPPTSAPTTAAPTTAAPIAAAKSRKGTKGSKAASKGSKEVSDQGSNVAGIFEGFGIESLSMSMSFSFSNDEE
ncbi:hypothetical protein ACHAW5_003253 [Stephanodiscus triporus]|uniref:Uncharacterized protein n=1 Tax=Stephanodiscus triporus TaxID=2934178 RepID=A0ABD3NJQ8_9STRA